MVDDDGDDDDGTNLLQKPFTLIGYTTVLCLQPVHTHVERKVMIANTVCQDRVL